MTMTPSPSIARAPARLSCPCLISSRSISSVPRSRRTDESDRLGATRRCPGLGAVTSRSVREGVAAHAIAFEIAVRELGVTWSRCTGIDSAPGSGRGCRAHSRAMGRGGRHPYVFTAPARGIRRGRAAVARRERADRRAAPVPGARRLLDAARAVGIAARPHDRVRRRRQ